MDSGKKKARPNPRTTANPVSVLFFWWLKDLFLKGSKNDLEIDDLYEALEDDVSEDVGDRLEIHWRNELAKVQRNEKLKPSLTRALINAFFREYILQGGLLAIQYLVLRVLQPLFLGSVIRYFSPDNETLSREAAYCYAAGLIVTCVLNLFCMHHYNVMTLQFGMRVRVACCSLIYRKILRLSKTALGQTTTGQMVNLMSNDVVRFDLIFLFLHFIWLTPIQVVVVTYFIWESVRWAAIIGVVGLFFQTIPVQSYMSKLTSTYRLKIAKKTDDRVRLMNEIISGIQVIKMYAWEKPFEKMVEIARSREIKYLKGASYLRGIYLAFMVFTERTSLYVTLVAYTLLGNTVTADRVFSLAQFFNLLQLTMAICYPQAVQLLAETKVSVQRIEDFLLLEEHTPKVNSSKNVDEKEKIGVNIKNACARWVPGTISETITNITLEVRPGKLCAIVGPVGSGKTSLLHAILGELTLSSGSMHVSGEISYASQEPWLFVGSIRQNILFGQPYDARRYKEVVRVCALKRDFELFPYGDKTMVGERGVSLSGGQRARINMARAVYRQADIYLFDDPLSAVDTHVGKHLFEECLIGYLSNKTRILVTHQVQYLKDADLIVILNNGQIENKGTFNELAVNKSSFSDILSNSQEEAEETDDSAKSLKKQVSTSSAYSSGVEEEEEVDEPDENTEMMAKGTLNKSLYKDYFTAGSGSFLLSFMVFTLILGQIASSSADYWVSFWTNKELEKMQLMNADFEKGLLNASNPYGNYESQIGNKTLAEISGDLVFDSSTGNGSYAETETPADVFSNPDENLTTTLQSVTENVTMLSSVTPESVIVNSSFVKEKHFDESMYYTRDQYILIYTACIICCICFTILRSIMFFKVCMNSSQGLHDHMFNSILKGTMRFFDTNPSGRVLNRFSKDMGAIDEILPRAMLDSIQIFLVMFGILTMVVIVNYYLLIAIVIVGPVFYKIRVVYLATAQDIKRLEGITRSPVFSYLSASLNGLTTIRSSGAQTMVTREFDNFQDSHTSAWYLTIATNGAFGFWLDVVSVTFVSAVILSFFFLDSSIEGGNVGLAISQALILTGMLQYGIRQTAEVVNQMTSVERVLQYNDIEKEPPFESQGDQKFPPRWPEHGAVQFANLSLRYAPTESPVLKDLQFTIQSGHKVGIVGRTGAGKSSLISALFRLAKLEGAIYIDDVNTQAIGIHDLRKKISIIPQEPVLFSASLRYNLDPFGEFPDVKLWDALEEVELKDCVESLDHTVNEGGSNFSAGQRQLICLARAILRNNKILVLDEATANVDPQTDSLIQVTIRTKFKDCTVLTIAHRLNTIMDSDRVLVMDSGTMVEYAHPFQLLKEQDGYFNKLVQETGKTMSEQLTRIAQQSYENCSDPKETENQNSETSSS